MGRRNQLSPTYASGTDFADRVGAAAVRLGVVRREDLGPAEVEDLVALAAHGRIVRPASGLAAHLERHREVLLGGGEDLVHWLRRLVFRGAWIDQQVADGRIGPVFEQPGGFTYRSALTGATVAADPPLPDWSDTAYGADG